MKNTLFLIALAGILQVSAQETLPRAEALRLAFEAGRDLAQLQGTPIPTDVDLKRPIAIREGDYGGLFLPEAKLTPETIGNAGDKIIPIGQLWLHQLTPMQDGQAIPATRLRMANAYLDGYDVQVAQCTLGIRRTGASALQLVVLGKTAEPIATAPLSVVNRPSAEPISLTAETDYAGGTAKVVLFGKYQAQLSFTELAN